MVAMGARDAVLRISIEVIHGNHVLNSDSWRKRARPGWAFAEDVKWGAFPGRFRFFNAERRLVCDQKTRRCFWRLPAIFRPGSWFGGPMLRRFHTSDGLAIFQSASTAKRRPPIRMCRRTSWPAW